jgi:kinetochore protein Mis13/DSN1
MLIKEALLKDFGNKSEFSDWFDRKDSARITKVIKTPNPRNVEHQEKIAALEERVKL